MGANPIRQPLQPEAIGAVMEVTKWLKPSIKARDWPRTMPARVLPASSVRARVALVVRSELGQTKTNSVRAYVFRFALQTRTSLGAFGMSQRCHNRK
jgi:hypothetical protein